MDREHFIGQDSILLDVIQQKLSLIYSLSLI